MAKGNRKAFIETAISMLNEIDKGNPSIELLKQNLESLPEKQFQEFIARLRNGVADKPDLDKPRELIPLVFAPLGKSKVSARGNIDLGKKWGISFFERIWMVDPTTKMRYLTNIPYAVLELPMMRQVQTLEKGIGYTESDTVLDSATHQVSKAVSGASLSGPEVQSLLSQGRRATVREMMKFRGGDDKAYRAMSRSLQNTGRFQQESYQENTRAKSTDVVKMYFTAKHLDVSL